MSHIVPSERSCEGIRERQKKRKTKQEHKTSSQRFYYVCPPYVCTCIANLISRSRISDFSAQPSCSKHRIEKKRRGPLESEKRSWKGRGSLSLRCSGPTSRLPQPCPMSRDHQTVTEKRFSTNVCHSHGGTLSIPSDVPYYSYI